MTAQNVLGQAPDKRMGVICCIWLWCVIQRHLRSYFPSATMLTGGIVARKDTSPMKTEYTHELPSHVTINGQALTLPEVVASICRKAREQDMALRNVILSLMISDEMFVVPTVCG